MNKNQIIKEIEEVEANQLHACMSNDMSTNYILLLNLRKEYLLGQLEYERSRPYVDGWFVAAVFAGIVLTLITLFKIYVS